MKLTARDIEIAVAKYFDYRRNLIVPNVHWGIGLPYECDLVVLRPSNWAVEVEIKVTRGDIRADLRKKIRHDSLLFRELYFAVPRALADDPNIPARAGILSLDFSPAGVLRATKVRVARRCKNPVRWSAGQRQKLYDVASMRTWTLKQHLAARELKDVRDLRDGRDIG